MPSEADRGRLVSVTLPATTELTARLHEIAAVPPGATVSAVVRYLFDVGLSKWEPIPQMYKIDMLSKVGQITRVMIRTDQEEAIQRIMAMGFGRAVVFDVTLRLGDKWRARGNSTEDVEPPNTGTILQGPKEQGKRRAAKHESGALVPDREEESIGGRIEQVRALLRGGDTDSSEHDDSQESEEEFPRPE